jgi:hypothetical protein
MNIFLVVLFHHLKSEDVNMLGFTDSIKSCIIRRMAVEF